MRYLKCYSIFIYRFIPLALICFAVRVNETNTNVRILFTDFTRKCDPTTGLRSGCMSSRHCEGLTWNFRFHFSFLDNLKVRVVRSFIKIYFIFLLTRRWLIDFHIDCKINIKVTLGIYPGFHTF